MKKAIIGLSLIAVLFVVLFNYACIYDFLIDKFGKSYEKLDNEIATFSKALDESEYLTMKYTVWVKNETVTQIIRAKSDPLYIEIIGDGVKDYVYQEGDSVFYYQQLDNFTYKRKYMGSLSKYLESSDMTNTEDFFAHTFTKDNSEIKVNGREYKITSTFEDAMDSELKTIIEELCKEQKQYPEYLFSKTLYTTYTFDDKKMIISASLTIENNNIMLSGDISIRVSLEMDLESFETVNILEKDYRLANAEKIEDVYSTYVFDTFINLESYETTYVKIEAKSGVLVCDSQFCELYLYDINKNLVSSSIGTGDLSRFIKVLEDGTYYLEIRSKISGEQSIKISSYAYNTLYSEAGIDLNTTTSYSGSFEGEYDFEKFVYNDNDYEDKTIEIKNTGSNTIIVYCSEKNSIKIISPNEVASFGLYYKTHTFYVYIDSEMVTNLSTYPYSIDVTIK